MPLASAESGRLLVVDDKPLEMLAGEQFDLVLLGVEMPEMRSTTARTPDTGVVCVSV